MTIRMTKVAHRMLAVGAAAALTAVPAFAQATPTAVTVTPFSMPSVDYSGVWGPLMLVALATLGGGAAAVLGGTGAFAGFEWIRSMFKRTAKGK